MKFTVQQIAQLVGGIVEGNPDALIETAAKIQEAKTGSIAFLANPKYEPFLYETQASAVLVNANLVLQKEVVPTLIRVPDAYIAFTKLLGEYQKMTQKRPTGIEQPAFIAPSATIDQEVYVGAFAYVGEQVKVGRGVQIFPQVYIGANCEIGEGTVLYAGVKLYPNTKVGKNCQIHAGAVIGSDGFGFAPRADGSYETIPQLGNVVIEDEVSIGANTTIDCATLGATLIEKGAKLDNLIQIGHNVRIGAHTVMAAQTGISGSTSIGSYCMIGGQVGMAGHIEVADKTRIGAQSGLSKSVKKAGTSIIGSPAVDYVTQIKNYVVGRNLAQLQERVLDLERKIATLFKG
ncbi:UDP-3-O-(3-hydroxymyristoyl)glucosamine N-acyltransferase [Hugenholtzia roseola]|uniref:UDP-3-O-(3-hydroxymyristoyl)glucosamine N-acyltransferase n=1 Tax=Hugenholtzia roseola TaxID=1002 RepID=UPI0004131374|nr:UDP-3-O-(3-hydroxymyristoyl)glucosamine N-acyltransferase [Hugenholtzia roseola]